MNGNEEKTNPFQVTPEAHRQLADYFNSRPLSSIRIFYNPGG